MKVVLFCGGRGIRLRELCEAIPKPMVTIGYRPILWHVMRYYAHFGHRDFILCLGYRADAIKEYFLRYEEALSNDFVLSDGGRQIELLGSDIQDWRITFADTGLDSTIGERLRLVRHHLEGEELFLANYGDTLTDAPLDRIVADFAASDAVASFLSVRAERLPVPPPGDGRWLAGSGARPARRADLWINGGYFVLRHERLRRHPARRRAGRAAIRGGWRRRASAGTVRYDGFWAPMDTLRDVEGLEMLARAAVRRGCRSRPAGSSLMSELGARLGLPRDRPVRCLAIGAHADDIEIGAGGTILRLFEERPDTSIDWIVLAADGERAERGPPQRGRARWRGGDARGLSRWSRRLPPVRRCSADKGGRRGGRGGPARPRPRAIAPTTPTRTTGFAAELAWQLCRWSTILEYEVPKWDGDMGPVNLYVPLDPRRPSARSATCWRRSRRRRRGTGSPPTRFVRSCGCAASRPRSPSGLAEAFVARKLIV